MYTRDSHQPHVLVGVRGRTPPEVREEYRLAEVTHLTYQLTPSDAKSGTPFLLKTLLKNALKGHPPLGHIVWDMYRFFRVDYMATVRL